MFLKEKRKEIYYIVEKHGGIMPENIRSALAIKIKEYGKLCREVMREELAKRTRRHWKMMTKVLKKNKELNKRTKKKIIRIDLSEAIEEVRKVRLSKDEFYQALLKEKAKLERELSLVNKKIEEWIESDLNY